MSTPRKRNDHPTGDECCEEPSRMRHSPKVMHLDTEQLNALSYPDLVHGCQAVLFSSRSAIRLMRNMPMATRIERKASVIQSAGYPQ